MSKPPHILADPKKPESIIKSLKDVARVVDGDIEFGHPLNPYDDQSVVLAGAGIPTTHNGSLQNIKGSWVEAFIGAGFALDTPYACTHNLNVPVVSATEPNVRWLVFGFKHDGTAVDAASTISVNYEIGDTVAEDYIELRFYAGGTRDVSQTREITATLFFIPAVR